VNALAADSVGRGLWKQARRVQQPRVAHGAGEAERRGRKRTRSKRKRRNRTSMTHSLPHARPLVFIGGLA
jgi:hypothetical protein